MQSSAVILRPSTVLELIDHAFRIYRQNFVIFIILVALVHIPVALITYSLQRTLDDNRTYQGYSTFAFDQFNSPTYYQDQQEIQNVNNLSQVVNWIGIFVQVVFINSLITVITSETYLGYQTGFGQILSMSIGRVLSLGLTLLLAGIIFGVLGVITLVASLCLVGLLGIPVLLYYGLAFYFFIVPTIMLEDVGISDAMNRALVMGRKRFWRTLGLAFGTWLLTLVIGLVITGIVAVGMGGVETNNPTYNVIVALLGMVAAPVLPIALTLMYYDTRIRLEGLDIALQVTSLPTPRPDDLISPHPTMPLFVTQDVSNMAMITGIGIGIFGALFALILGLVWLVSLTL